MTLRRSTRAITVFLGGIIVVSSCGSGSARENRSAGVYEAVVRWFADRTPDDRHPLTVFVEAKPAGAVIDLGIQASVIGQTERVASVRFIDDRTEALDDSGPDGTEVRDDGILIRLPPVPDEGDRVTLEVDLWVDDETTRAYRFDLRSREGRWHVEGSPTELADTRPG